MTTVKLFCFPCAIVLFSSLFFQACKKDAGVIISPRRDTVQIIRNTVPVVYAGEDIYVSLPADSCILKGSASDKENNIINYSWKKLTGPTTAFIEKSNFPETKVRELHMGEYSFELTVTDLMGLQGRDTVKVYVLQLGQNEMIFKDLVWVCPMGCSVEIKDFYSFIPRDKPFHVFLRKTTSSAWQLVKKDDEWVITDIYMYGIWNDIFWIYGDDETGTVDVKIQF